MSSSCCIQSDGVEKNIYRRLKPIVHQCLRLQNFEVIDITEISPVPPGENYCSLVVRLKVSVRRMIDDQKETLALVAKMGMKYEIPFVDWPKTFEKEAFFYNELLPAYRELEKKAGIDEANLIDFLPRHYMGNDFINNANHDHSILLLENLKSQGFYSVHKDVGMDFDHAKQVLSTLAKFHALGVALKEKRPAFMADALKIIKLQTIRKFIFDHLLVGICKTFRSHSRLAKYENALKISVESYHNVMYSNEYKPNEPWATIIHGDTWANNILFHKNRNGDIDRVKFIDYQLSLYASPLMEIPLFFCTSVDELVLMNNSDKLLDVYYRNFIDTLNRVSCDTDPFTRESFDCELKEQAKIAFSFCAMTNKFFSFDVERENNHEKLHASIVENSENFLRRAIKIVEVYNKHGWFLSFLQSITPTVVCENVQI